MNRTDERKMTGASMARSPGAARRDEESHVTGHVSKEHDERDGAESTSEGSAMARSPGKARSDQARVQREESTDMKDTHDEVRSGRGIKREHVDADHVMGTGGGIATASAEGEPDMASSKANRKEAMEPEREAQEKSAIGGERSVPHKHTMSHGERETVAKHTI